MKLMSFICRLYLRYHLYWMWRVGVQRAIVGALICAASLCNAANTNKVDKVEKEKKTEHQANKIVVKERDKGSKKESDWKVVKEYPLMFSNNRKAKKEKTK
jgi:hypothetical protein